MSNNITAFSTKILIKELYNENYKSLKSACLDNTKTWKEIPHLWIDPINIAKMVILTKATYKFSEILIKILMTLFTEI
jgi:hypothetical protein